MAKSLSDLNFEESDEDYTPKFVELEPGQKPPSEEDNEPDLPDEVKSKSKADLYNELQQLRQKADPVDAIERGLRGLKDDLRAPAPVQQVVQPQQPGESDEAFRERINEQLFKADNPSQLIEELVERKTKNLQAQVGNTTMELKRQLMKTNPQTSDVFNKYEQEIVQRVQSLPAQDQSNPGAFDWAYQQTLNAHLDDIIEERAKKLAEGSNGQGEGSEESQGSQEPLQMSQARGGSSGKVKIKAKNTVYVTDDDRRIAAQRGIDPRDVALYRVNSGG